MSWIIFKVSSIDFIFRDLFSAGLEGDESQKKVVHGPEPVYGSALQELFPLLFLCYVHY